VKLLLLDEAKDEVEPDCELDLTLEDEPDDDAKDVLDTDEV